MSELETDDQDTIDALAGEGEGEQAAKAGASSSSSEAGYSESLAQQLEQMLEMLGGMMAPRLGQHWTFTKHESREFGVAAARCLEAWLGDIELTPTWQFVLVASTVLGPRIAVTIAQQQQAQTVEGEADGRSE